MSSQPHPPEGLPAPSPERSSMALPMKKAVMKKVVLKKAGAMKSMKAMKAKRVSVIARGRGARARVFSGRKEKTGLGLTKDHGVEAAVGAWEEAVGEERPEGLGRCREEGTEGARLGLTGFVAIGGKSAAGKALKSLL